MNRLSDQFSMFYWFLLLIFLPLNILASELSPDTNEAHCKAFAGTWDHVNSKCKERYEFQQGPIFSSFFTPDMKQWCESRGGKHVSTRRGKRCRGAKNIQGITRYKSSDIENFEVRADIVNRCIDQLQVHKQSCEVRATNEDNHWFNYTEDSSAALTGFMHFATKVVNGLGTPLTIMSYLRGTRERNLVVSELSYFLHKNRLTSCQRACLVKCASATVLSYEDNLVTKLGGMRNSYDLREGVCTEFSRVATDLGKQLGVDVQAYSGPRHAYNRFKIDGRWYYGEPQSDSCEFFHSVKTLDDYENVFASEDEVYDGGRTEIMSLPVQNNRRSRGNRSQSR